MVNWSWKKFKLRCDLAVNELTNSKLNLNCGSKSTSCSINFGPNLTSPHRLTCIYVWLGKVTLESAIGLKFINATAMEHTCLEASESTIQMSLEEKVGLTDLEWYIPAAYVDSFLSWNRVRIGCHMSGEHRHQGQFAAFGFSSIYELDLEKCWKLSLGLSLNPRGKPWIL